jgi:tRNA(Ile)-lysidine synthase
VATGHTADDQAETVLMRVLRGTGLAGLAGIARLRQLSADITAIRPLLTVTRQMLQTALREVGQSWLDDATNDDRRYTRNWIRHDLLPRLRQRLPNDVDTSLQQLAQQATGWHSWHSELAESLVRQLVDIRWQGERRLVQIDVAGLVNTRLLGSPLPDMLVAELFRHVWRQQGWPEQSMGERQWQQLVAACHSERGLRLELPGGVGARRETHHLVLAR